MFGTIARSRLKDGVTVEQVEALFGDTEERPPESVALMVFQSANDPREIWIASAFASREASVKNADSPEQHARFERIQTLSEGQPEWHDGTVLLVATEDRVLSAT